MGSGNGSLGRRMEAWASCLLGLWEGSQWFAKNSPESWLLPPRGQPSRVPPLSRAKALADGLFMFPVTGAQHRILPGSSKLSLGGGSVCLPRLLTGTWGKRRSGSTGLYNPRVPLPLRAFPDTSALTIFLPANRPVVIKNTGSGKKPPGSEFLLPPSLAVWPRARNLTSLCLKSLVSQS